MLEELGPSWTVTELQELLADLACEQEAALPPSPGDRTGLGNTTSVPA